MVKITFHGHACFVLEADGRRVIIDPFITGNPATDVSLDRLPKVDAVLLSHGHGDHLGDAVPIARRDAATIVATFELAKFCEKQGAVAHAMHIGGAHQFPFGRVKLVPAFHGGQIEGDDTGRYTTNPCGIVATLGGRAVYHTGDTALTLEMQLLVGQVDVLLWKDMITLPLFQKPTLLVYQTKYKNMVNNITSVGPSYSMDQWALTK